MPLIQTNNLNILGRLENMTLFTNSLDANGYSNITVADNLHVNGNMYTSGRVDVGSTIYATFRLQSNIGFPANEIQCTSNSFIMDWTSTDLSGIQQPIPVKLSVPTSNVFNTTTGEITVPISGLYVIEMQGAFINGETATNIQNGVYYYFNNLPFPNARVSAQITNGQIASSSHTAFLLGGDHIVPCFYSNDLGAYLDSSKGETYVRFVLTASVTPTHSNYVRYVS